MVSISIVGTTHIESIVATNRHLEYTTRPPHRSRVGTARHDIGLPTVIVGSFIHNFTLKGATGMSRPLSSLWTYQKIAILNEEWMGIPTLGLYTTHANAWSQPPHPLMLNDGVPDDEK